MKEGTEITIKRKYLPQVATSSTTTQDCFVVVADSCGMLDWGPAVSGWAWFVWSGLLRQFRPHWRIWCVSSMQCGEPLQPLPSWGRSWGGGGSTQGPSSSSRFTLGAVPGHYSQSVWGWSGEVGAFPVCEDPSPLALGPFGQCRGLQIGSGLQYGGVLRC